VPIDDLSSIPDLQDKYRKVLAGQLKITSFRALAHADRQDIYRAMRDSRLRPTHEQIAKWQGHARSRLKEATTDRSDWHPAASFAVVFAQRQVSDGWEYRIEVERTEVEPEEERRIWPGWDCGGICEWMRDQISGAGPEPKAEVAGPAEPTVTPAGATPAPAGVATERRELRIDRVTVIGQAASAEGAAASSADPTKPPRIEISVSGGRRGQAIHAAAQVLREGEFGENLQAPVVIRGATGVASFDLSALPAGRYHLALAAWVPDGTAWPARAELPDLTIAPR
jgi:hypothetical protein